MKTNIVSLLITKIVRVFTTGIISAFAVTAVQSHAVTIDVPAGTDSRANAGTAATGLTKTGSGTLQLTDASHSFTGDIDVQSGKLRFVGDVPSNGRDNVTRTLGGGNFGDNINIAAGATLEYWSNGGSGTPQEFSGNISGGGFLDLGYSATYILSGSNTFSGTTRVAGSFSGTTATLETNKMTNVGDLLTLGNGGKRSNAYLNYTGIGEMTNQDIEIAQNSNSNKGVSNLGSGTLTFTTPWTATNRTTVGAWQTTTDSDLILQGFNLPNRINNFEKRGDGVFSVSGPNEIVGSVRLFGGTLELGSEINDGGVYQGTINTVGGSNIITIPNTSVLQPGMIVSHSRGRIPKGTTVVSILSPTTAEISSNANSTRAESGAIGSISSLGLALPSQANLRFYGDAAIRYTGPDNSSNRGFTIDNGRTATWDVANSGTTLAFTGGTAATSGSLTKVGAGTLILGGDLNYTGATIVNGGELDIAGTLAGGGSVAVNSGTLSINGTLEAGPNVVIGANGTIGGNGTINRGIQNNGTIAPGNSIGMLTVGDLSPFGTYQWELADATGTPGVAADGTAGTDWDLLIVSGGVLDLAGGGVIEATGLSGLPTGLDISVAGAESSLFEILNAPGGISNFNAANFAFTGSLAAIGDFDLTDDGFSLFLQFTSTVPEPGTWALFGLMMIGCIVAIRRRKQA